MNWSYFFKHWFGTLLLGPIISEILVLLTIINSHQVIGLLEVYPLSIIFSLFFSTPTYILYALLYYYLGKKSTNPNYAKSILILFVVVGVIVTTFILKGSVMQGVRISYVIASILAGFFFKLDFKPKQ